MLTQRTMPLRRAHLVLVFVFFVLVNNASTTTITRDLELAPGLTLHVDTLESKVANSTTRHALRLTYDGLAVRLAATDDDQDYRISVLHAEEGRGRRHWNMMSEMIIPALLGYKTSALTFVLLFGMLAFVAKAMTVASVAVLAAAALWLRKLFFAGGGFGDSKTVHSIADYDHHASGMHPVYAEYPGDISDLGYAQTAAGNYIAYGDPHGDAAAAAAAAAASDPHYAYVEAPPGGANFTIAQRRRTSAPVKKAVRVPTYVALRRKTRVS